MKLSKFKIDHNVAEEGQWVDIGDGVELKIARMGNRKYNETIRRLSKPHKYQIDNDTLPQEISEEIMNKAVAECILLDWKGLEDDDGQPINYSRQKAFELLSDPDLAPFKRQVIGIAQTDETFRNEMVEDTVKN